ncbi:hypothetical protein MML48_1g14591 [Holotrichia oblita]|uniref:Uncharacterized protein n=2 Tax=Holotrichia oblita TaxID=644536 RepID=A0ACB9TWU2_HOLOL|nr:hypothetical protein MML48_1g17155 [Holotrichia oblita]KAI4471251.1 hypothetical protein MML48_1g14591 [Holotrichia oblita]
MQVLFFFASLICFTASAPTVEESGIANDIADFLEIVPIEKIKKIAIQHLHDDPEFQAAIQYIKSPEFVGMMAELQSQPEIIELKNFLRDAGIDLDKYGGVFCGFLREVNVTTDHKEKSLKKFVDDVRDIMPMAKLIQTFDLKMNTSPAFKEFYNKITSEEAHKLISKVRALPIFKKIVAEIKKMDVDLDRIFKIAYAVFGWTDDISQ